MVATARKVTSTRSQPTLKWKLLGETAEAMPDDAEFDRLPMDASADDEMLLDPAAVLSSAAPSTSMEVDAPLNFPALPSHATAANTTQSRKVSIPPHRMTPLKKDWMALYTPLVEECGLQVRMNPKKKIIEIKVGCSLLL
jgi:hypothetical protein